MTECCSNCRMKVELQTWDYSKVGSDNWKTTEPGYVCMAFASEGTVIHMVGHDPDGGMCEMYASTEEGKHEQSN